jgi:ElaB/YqjD/DUF883 family membrane-anchored ribosome-binding protein
MSTTKSNQKTARAADEQLDQAKDQAKEITRDVVDYLTDYARQNPGYAALVCLGVGFVLGRKLKPR